MSSGPPSGRHPARHMGMDETTMRRMWGKKATKHRSPIIKPRKCSRETGKEPIGQTRHDQQVIGGKDIGKVGPVTNRSWWPPSTDARNQLQ